MEEGSEIFTCRTFEAAAVGVSLTTCFKISVFWSMLAGVRGSIKFGSSPGMSGALTLAVFYFY